MSKSGVFGTLKMAYSDQLINRETPDNPVNQELLVKMLEFANQFEDDDRYVYDNALAKKMMTEPMLLMNTTVMTGHAAFGLTGLYEEDIAFIGYPDDNKNGHLIQSYNTLAISTGSQHKEIAWSFISTLLSKDSQMRMEESYHSAQGFSIRKDVLEIHFDWVMENSSSFFLATNSGGTATYRFVPGDVREEDIQKIRTLIQSADTVRTYSPEIDQIILDEAALYFDGTKSVSEVVAVIENRVRTYVLENM